MMCNLNFSGLSVRAQKTSDVFRALSESLEKLRLMYRVDHLLYKIIMHHLMYETNPLKYKVHHIMYRADPLLYEIHYVMFETNLLCC